MTVLSCLLHLVQFGSTRANKKAERAAAKKKLHRLQQQQPAKTDETERANFVALLAAVVGGGWLVGPTTGSTGPISQCYL